ncbi:MAG: TonB-dependent receptor [Gammaproteobacteria bacterium]|nr:TonB-dependent receptor [Gammaproteobacteria bacterium]
MRALLLIDCLVLGLIGAQAYAEGTLRHFDIRAQPAAPALNEFARQADITLVFSSTLVARYQTPAVQGDFTVADGLRKLLDGTGLSFNLLSPSTIAIGALSASAEPRDPPASGLDGAAEPANNDRQSKGESIMNHRGFFTRVAGLFAVSGALLTGGHAIAQDTAQAAPGQTSAADASAANTSTLDEIVVTGAAESKGLKKLDASFSITTASLEEIRDVNPSSAADLLKIVPGIWAESSAGAAGANIELAGFPGGGDAPYITYSLNGSPIYPASTLSFMDNSSQFRLDESVERAEVLQGGPGVVLANGQMGATANFILRQGTATSHGDLGITYGFEGMYRVDGFYSGPLAQDWFASIGGFYRNSNGIRNSQYPADDGGQLTATITHTLDSGTIMFFARDLNDKNLFITDVPVTVTGNGSGQSVSAFPGFNPNTGTFAGSGLRGISVQETATGAPVTADLSKGRGANLHMFGSDLDLQLNDRISLSNKLMYSAGEVDCYCLFNNLPPQTLSSFLNDPKTGVITTTNANPAITGPYGLATSGTATLVGTGAALNPNSYVASMGFWIVQKQIQSFTDDLRFTFDLGFGDKLTVGGYLATYSSNDHWWLGNNQLITGTQNAQLVDLTLNNGVNVTNPAGQLGASFFTLNENWNGRNTALFASDQWKFGPWLLDAGYRVEQQVDHGSIENDTATNLDANPLNLYNKGVSVPNGTFNQGVNCDTSGGKECTEYNHTFGSWSIGANYEITPHMSVYGRINQGLHFPGFDDLRNGQPQTQHIKNYEIGYRIQTGTFYGVISGWHRTFTGVPFQQFTAAGNSITATYGATSSGTDFEARWEPIPHLSLDLSGDWQRALYASYSSATLGGANYTGNYLQRQPRLQFRLTPAYEVPMDFGALRVFMTYTHAGLRYEDIANQQILPSYYTLDAGVVGEFGRNFEVRVQGSNLTNQIGLTEGNARIAVGSGSGITNNFEMARPIFGREVNVQLRYKF